MQLKYSVNHNLSRNSSLQGADIDVEDLQQSGGEDDAEFRLPG